MPRFAVLTHDHPFLHWDFLLEQGASCRTWRLLAPPDQGGVIRAQALADHRLEYLHYQGPVSGNRGTVTTWDAGIFEWTTDVPGTVEVQLAGRRLTGPVRLVRTGDSWEWSAVQEPPTIS